ncbi:MAG: LysR family transcriptional regulator, partial [Bdellovibrionales bacterium]|nr:LysR family transcriptional regulator [Bdellovibrionales bacterium]
MNTYNYNHFYYFYITAKLKAVTAAAKHLNTSQSSLSIQIKNLEGRLGKPLFKKAGRNIQLTPYGKEIYSFCRRAFETFDEMSDHLASRNSSMGVRISLGVSAELERFLSSSILLKVSHFYKKTNRPLLNVLTLPSTALLTQLKLGELDLALTSELVRDAEITSIGKFDLPMGIFAAPQLFAKNTKISDLISQKENIPFVLPSKTTTLRTEIEGYFIRKKFNPPCVFESNNLTAVVRVTLDGLGLTILPYAFVASELATKKLVSLSDKPIGHHR